MKHFGDINTHYGTLAEALATAKRSRLWNSRSWHDVQWYGGTYDATADLATNGWSEGAREAASLATRIADRMIATSGVVMSTELTPDVCGAAYDVGALASGVPECWITFSPSTAKRAVHFCVCVSASGCVPADAYRKRGIAVAALALALNAAGYPLTIDVADIGVGNHVYSATVRVADAMSGSQLDIDRMAFALAHPAMFRRIFRTLVGHNNFDGSEPPLHDERPTATAYDMYLGGMHMVQQERWYTDPQGWVAAEYKRQTESL